MWHVAQVQHVHIHVRTCGKTDLHVGVFGEGLPHRVDLMGS